MTPLRRFITEIWREESLAVETRLVKLGEKRQDSGLTPEEEVEYAVAKEESGRLLTKMLHDLRGVRSSRFLKEKKK